MNEKKIIDVSKLDMVVKPLPEDMQRVLDESRLKPLFPNWEEL